MPRHNPPDIQRVILRGKTRTIGDRPGRVAGPARTGAEHNTRSEESRFELGSGGRSGSGPRAMPPRQRTPEEIAKRGGTGQPRQPRPARSMARTEEEAPAAARPVTGRGHAFPERIEALETALIEFQEWRAELAEALAGLAGRLGACEGWEAEIEPLLVKAGVLSSGITPAAETSPAAAPDAAGEGNTPAPTEPPPPAAESHHGRVVTAPEG